MPVFYYTKQNWFCWIFSHTAAIAAGNNGIPLRMHGYEFGKASGMAPRARYADVQNGSFIESLYSSRS